MLDRNLPVRVFKNWKHGCYNILQGRFLMSAREVCLADVEFRVRESGRQRMLASGRKNVHAFAVGNLVDFVPANDSGRLSEEAANARAVYYNPFEAGSFLDTETRSPVAGASRAFFTEKGATYQDQTAEDAYEQVPNAA